jgi:CheY-like chemotaxis protein
MSQLANFNVLILDDNTDFHSVIRNAIYDIGVQNVRSCASISEAQQVMTDGFAPNLILMEINLEGVGGLNFMRQVRAGKMAVVADAPIIIMSEGLKPQTAFSACDVGFEHFLRKPFKADAVQKRVKAVMEKPILDRTAAIKIAVLLMRMKNAEGLTASHQLKQRLPEKQ